jgi:hypothetical protein
MEMVGKMIFEKEDKKAKVLAKIIERVKKQNAIMSS